MIQAGLRPAFFVLFTKKAEKHPAIYIFKKIYKYFHIAVSLANHRSARIHLNNYPLKNKKIRIPFKTGDYTYSTVSNLFKTVFLKILGDFINE